MLDNDLKRAYNYEDELSEDQIGRVDAVVNQVCVDLSPEELGYLLKELCELNHRGDF